MSRFNRRLHTAATSAAEKRDYNRAHFAAAAARYDVATIAMSLGRDRSWKRLLVVGLPYRPHPRCLDLACGSGDLSRHLADRYPDGQVIGLDLSREMLARALAHGGPPHLDYLQGDLHALPLAATSCDLVTGGYALRNAPDLPRALSEIARVLRPGGHAAFLDFAKAATPRGQRWQYRLLRGWCGLWGRLLSGSWQVHGYIADSLAGFPAAAELDALLRAHGLEPLCRRRLFGGMLQLLHVVRQENSAVVKGGAADNRAGR